MWDRIQRLHEHHGDVPLEIRILKITEEVAEAFIGVRGLNAARVYAGPTRISWTESPTPSSWWRCP